MQISDDECMVHGAALQARCKPVAGGLQARANITPANPVSATAPHHTVPLLLHLAATPQLRLGGRELNPGTRKALALALLVALEPGLRRARAADLLWPDIDPAAARRNLRRDLFRLRQLGLALADGAGDTLTLSAAEPVWPLPAALPPRWLDGLDELAGPEFAHWVDQQRVQLQRRWLAGLVDQARGLEQGGLTRAAVQAWRALLADGAAGPGHAEARAALQRLQPDIAEPDAEAATAPAALGAGRRIELPFVGRQAERTAIEQALAQGLTVLIDGSPGVGKTRLALEALAAQGGVLVLRCRPEDAAVPYASALRGLQLLREAAPEVELPAWSRRDLSLLVPEWADRIATEPAALATARLQRAYQTALRTLADGNFGGLMIDDWQWADASSQALWEPAPTLRGPGPTALPCLVVHRSGELPQAALQRRRQWLDEGRAIAVHVPPLAEGEVRALLAALGAQGLGEAAHEQLIERSGGNPLVLIETLRHVQQGGASGLPASVYELIVARARALGPAVRRVLEAASLAGDELRPPLLAAAAGIDELAVAQALEHASVAELLLVDARGRHRFAHDLIAQAIADSLSAVRRRALHGQLAAGLIGENAEPGRIARHLDQAERAGEAAPWHLRAAQVALRRQAWPEAVIAGQAVLAACTDPALRFDAWLCCAHACRRRSDAAGAEAALQAALPDARHAGPQRVIDLCLERAELHSSQGRADDALAELRTLDADPALQPAQRRRLLQEQASAHGFLGRHAESLPLLRRMLAELPASALADRQRVFSLLARNAYWAGELDEARALVEQALALSRNLGDDVAVANGLYRLGVLDRERGLVEPALERLQQAAELARRAGHVELLRSALSTLATVRLDQMRLADAERLIVEGEQAAPDWDTPNLEDIFDERRFLLHGLRGEVDQAWAVCLRSIERHRLMRHLHSQLGSLMQAVGLSLLTGDDARARSFLDQALAVHAAAGADSLHGRELAVREVQVLRAEGHADEALRRADDWLASAQTRRVEEHARLLAAAAQAALDQAQVARSAALLAQASSLPAVPIPVQAALLAARVRCARAGGESVAAALAAAQAWLAQPALPVLEARLLQRALDARTAPTR